MTKTKAILMAGLLLCGASQGLELLNVVRLPDDGFGSDANAAHGGEMPPTEEVTFIFGSKNTADGRVVPVVWRVDAANLNVILDEIPASLRGEAIGGAVFPNGDMVVVGNVQIGNSQHGVLWRKPWMGEWSGPEPLAPNADGSLAARADYCADGGRLAVAGSVRMGAITIPVVFHITAELVDNEQLPVPAGASGQARDIQFKCTDWGYTAGLVAGSITDRRGNTHAVVWFETADGWATFPASNSGGGQSQANGVILLDNDGETEVARYLMAGSVMRAGRTVGLAAKGKYGTAEGYASALLAPLNGFQNSSALWPYHLGDTGTHEVGHFLGLSWNADESQAATLWFCDWVDYVRAVPAQQLLVNPSEVSNVLSLKTGDGKIMVGQCMDEEDFPPSACVFTPSGWHLPEIGDVVLAATGRGRQHDPTALWHDDESALRMRTERRGKERVAVVDLRFSTGQPPSSDPEACRRCMWPMCGGSYITARAEDNSSEVAGTLNVYAFNSATGEYRLKGSFELTGSEQTIEAFTWDCLDHDQVVNPATGEIQIRLEYVQEGRGQGALVLDMARLHGTSGDGEH